MQPFKVHILGCGSALPTLKHKASAQLVEMCGKVFMVDCGEGTQVQLRRARVHFNKVSCVFISHLHGDHCLGVVGMISTFGMLGRVNPLHIYAPASYEPMLKSQLEFFCNSLEYDVVFHPVDTTINTVIYEDKSLTVTTIPLQHRIECCGFLFKEKPALPHIRRDMIDYYGIPEWQRNNIKQGADWITPEGEVIANSRLTTPADKPRAYAYCSDTKYLPHLHELLKDVDLLYHEATYCDADEERAKLYFHSTAGQAAMVAKQANAKRLVLGHFSARYANEQAILDDAKKVFKSSVLADEMSIFDI